MDAATSLRRRLCRNLRDLCRGRERCGKRTRDQSQTPVPTDGMTYLFWWTEYAIMREGHGRTMTGSRDIRSGAAKSVLDPYGVKGLRMTALWLTFARWSTAALLAFSSALGLAIVLVLGSIAIYVLPVQVNAAGIATLMICLIFVALVLSWRRWAHNQYARALVWGLTIPACVGGVVVAVFRQLSRSSHLNVRDGDQEQG
jgi:hypothetical protein